jgi:valyl-tRNA synthetase
LRASVNIKPKQEISANLYTDDNELVEYFKNSQDGFQNLAKVSSLSITSKSSERSAKSIMSATSHTEIFVPLEGVIDLAEQITRLEKDLAKTQKELTKLNGKLSNERFVANAPKEIIEETNMKRDKLAEKVSSLESNLKSFKS